MTPKHRIDTVQDTHDGTDKPPIRVSELTPKANSVIHHPPKHSASYVAENDVLRIVKGNPNPQEVAVLSAVFTVLAARDRALRTTDNRWPTANPDTLMRDIFGPFHHHHTNLRYR